MLVLTRKVGEEIVINNDIVIRLLDIHGNRVRIGIVADPKISVMRGELLKNLDRQEKSSSAAIPSPSNMRTPEAVR